MKNTGRKKETSKSKSGKNNRDQMGRQGLSGAGVFRESLTDKCIRRKWHATPGRTRGVERSTVFPPSSTQTNFRLYFIIFFFSEVSFFPAKICQTDSEGGKHLNATHHFPKLLQRGERGGKICQFRSLVPQRDTEKEYM